MQNAHRENIKNLFRWWNGHVFSFDTVPGTNRKDDDGFDSGMDEAEAALISDGGFSDEESLGGENLGDDTDGIQAGRYHWRVQATNQPLALPVGMDTDSRRDDLSVIAVPWAREPTSVHSAGVASITILTSFAQRYEYLTLLMISRKCDCSQQCQRPV